MDVKEKIKQGYTYKVEHEKFVILSTGYLGILSFINQCRSENMKDEEIEECIFIWLGGNWKVLSSVGWRSFYRQANKRERQTIIDNFGEKYVDPIEQLLDDIVDLYPYEQWNRDSGDNKYKTIGASKSIEHMFYVIGTDGSIYMKEQFKLFPTEKP